MFAYIGLAVGTTFLIDRSIVALIVFLIGVPPMIAAFRAIANKRRTLIFLASWLLPIPILIALLIGNAYLFEASDIGTQLGSVFGIWLIVLITDLIAGALFILFGPRYLTPVDAEDKPSRRVKPVFSMAQRQNRFSNLR